MRRSVVKMSMLLSVATGACGGVKQPEGVEPLRVTGAWVRVSNVSASGAAYMTMENRDTSTLSVVRVSSERARSAELHETMHMEMPAGASVESSTGTAHGGMVHMTHLDSLHIPKSGSVTLKPGGVHVMLTELARPFTEGDTIPLLLALTDGRTVRVPAIVRAQQP